MGPNILKQIIKSSAFHVEDEIKIYFNILLKLWQSGFLELSQHSSPEYPFCDLKLGSNSG